MPKFILDLRWTPRGLENVPTGEFRNIRREAIDYAKSHSVNFFPPAIVERLVPTPVGPIWFVEGEAPNVAIVVARFNLLGNVTAQSFDYITDQELDDTLVKLFPVSRRS
jgi:hypothetical protein